MAEETLLTAARRVCTYLRIDDEHGGLITNDSLKALNTLAIQVELALKIEKQGPVRFAVAKSICFTYRTEDDLHRNAKMLGCIPGDVIKLFNPQTNKALDLIYGEKLEPLDLFYGEPT